ncbi:8-amino-7-oxononanoate synthase [bacterium]|nr:8-amino-7-oxononanoate synthase [bacterium]MBU1753935.1 8-amino-7-oxononanoate synthase [bacterium]
MDFLSKELEQLKKDNLYRLPQIIESRQKASVIINGQKYILFCSNDYLGLSNHPKLIEASLAAMQEYGTGSGASRLICGSLKIHAQLEREIALFKQTEDAIIFSSGYMANLGVISSLMNKSDLIIIDKLNHASLIDGARLSGAHLRVYPHQNIAALEKILSASSTYRRRMIITEGIFSMDGDIASLPEIVDLAKHYQAMVMVDDAHATGVLGKNGQGSAEYFGLKGKIDIQMGTFSKAIGGFGGFVAGKKVLIEYLKNNARSFIYSTSLPPSDIAASLKGLEIVQTEPKWREMLWNNINYLRQKIHETGLNTLNSTTQIIPVLTGSNENTLQTSNYLYNHGIFAPGIRPPSVPKEKGRIRLSVMATHTREELDCVASVLADKQ